MPQLFERWYVQHDDLIGGWCLTNVDRPPSTHDHTKGELIVASFLRFNDALWVATTHDVCLGLPGPRLSSTCGVCSTQSTNQNEIVDGWCAYCRTATYGHLTTD